MLKHRWIFAIALLLCHASSSGISAATSPRYNIRVWGPHEGLSSITAMTQTRDGYLWLGTLYGLVRFDGFNLTTFDENNTPGLENNRIFHLFEDSHRGLWVGTETAGIKLITDGRIMSVRPPGPFQSGPLRSACEDDSGAVWLYTKDGLLLRHKQGRVQTTNVVSNRGWVIADKSGPVLIGLDQGLFSTSTNVHLDSIDPPRQRLSGVTNLQFLLASQRGGFWCLADGLIQRWSANRREANLAAYPSTNWPVVCAAEDRDGNLVVGTYGDGVYWFDSKGGFARISRAEGLSANNVVSLLVDQENSLWVGTDGSGLNRVQRSFFEVFDNTEGRTPQSVAEDEQGGVWIGFNGGAGAVQYWKNGLEKSFGTNQDLLAKSVFVESNGNVWAGTQGPWEPGWRLPLGGLFAVTNNTVSPVYVPRRFKQDTNDVVMIQLVQSVSSIYQDRKGLLRVGTKNGLWVREGSGWKLLTTHDGLSSDDVRAIVEDAEGNLWIGTDTGGLNRYRDGKFASFHRSKDGLPSEHISSLHVDADGVLWIGTSAGLARFHAGKWTRYGVTEGLASNSIGYLLEDDQGFLWIGSNAGLMRIQKQALNDVARGLTNSVPCRTYGDSDGLPNGECTFGSQPAACKLRNGQLLFPTITGLASVDPKAIKRNTNQPPIVIEAVLIEGQPQKTGGVRTEIPRQITVPAGRENLEIQYTSLNLAAADKARFRYYMENLETKGWNDAGHRRVALYPKLPPGDYRFRVTACNEDGVWNETGASLAIIVLPPFWRTTWFLLASAICFLGAIIGIVHYASTQKLQRQLAGLRQQQAVEKERARIARDIHDQLGASLTQVSLLGEMVESDKESPAEVEAHAKQISQTARDTTRALDEIVWTVNPSNDTLDGLVNYVCKYAQDYLGVAGLRYRLDIPAQLPAADISPDVRHNVFLTVKEAITNIVRHARAQSVWIRLRLEPATFTLEIQDDGQGIANLEEKKAGSRNGLRNMARRLEDVGGIFDIGPAPERGTLVRLTVPLKNK